MFVSEVDLSERDRIQEPDIWMLILINLLKEAMTWAF